MKDYHERSCPNCKHFDYLEDSNSDGFINESNSGYYCGGRKETVHNLKSFPFKTEQKCFEPKR